MSLSVDLMTNQSVPMVLGNLVCTSNSLFNDTAISYDISRPLSTFDCSGNQISYIPYLGINSKSGQIVSFEQLSRDKFCESIFSINVRKDDVSIFSESTSNLSYYYLLRPCKTFLSCSLI